ncbi:MAG: aspartate 1-decarboxylase [Candidatus Diapherotrites archaeon]
MQLIMLKSKIHRATVTGADLDYEGSITIDGALMEAAGIIQHEKVEVWNVSNGKRFETYAVPAVRGSGEVIVNGAAAHRAKKGDLVIIAAFALLEEGEEIMPKIVHADSKNRAK